MAETPDPILIADDGELQDIRQLLNEMDLPWLECDGFTSASVPHSVSLLATNSRLALSSAAERPRCEIHLVMYESASRTLRRVLERSECDLVLEQPIAAHTLRLVVEQALYAGPERRRGPRVVVSAPVKLKGEGRARNATLVQLSLRGCGLLTDQDLKVGREITVTLPKNLTRTEPLEASGPVLAVNEASKGSPSRRASMAFRLMNGPSRRILSKVMEHYGAGAELRPRSPAKKAAPAPEPEAGERRVGARKRFTRRILAAGGGTSHTLIGCDLSAGGMRVRSTPDLALGDELKLAVHSRPGLPAIMVRAVVARDDGPDGVVLRFRDVPASIAARLETIMEDLPVLAVDRRPKTRPGVVVSEILEHE